MAVASADAEFGVGPLHGGGGNSDTSGCQGGGCVVGGANRTTLVVVARARSSLTSNGGGLPYAAHPSLGFAMTVGMQQRASRVLIFNLARLATHHFALA